MILSFEQKQYWFNDSCRSGRPHNFDENLKASWFTSISGIGKYNRLWAINHHTTSIAKEYKLGTLWLVGLAKYNQVILQHKNAFLPTADIISHLSSSDVTPVDFHLFVLNQTI